MALRDAKIVFRVASSGGVGVVLGRARCGARVSRM